MLTSRINVVALLTIALGVGAEVADARSQDDSQAKGVHVVASGQTLWNIARDYGCSVQQIRDANDLSGNLIRVGQTLRVPRDCKSSGAKGDGGGDATILTHYVTRGDTLGQIAKRYDTSVKDIKRRNGLRNDLIRPGQKLRIALGRDGRGRPIPGQSVGSPQRGKLVSGVQLPRDRRYHRRRPNRAWGANHTIHYIRQAVAIATARYPKLHALAIGDISSRRGGKIAQHKSHQSGRDADIGLYFKKRPKGYPKSFITGTRKNLHFAATWALIDAFARTASEPAGVQVMFLNYEVQELIYKWAKDHKVPSRKLTKLFQYPHGKYASHGLIRHEPGHSGHIHVRFKCPPGDDSCH